MSVNLAQTNDDLFAVYQTMYSNADTNMSYDWNCRLRDTKWAKDQCYFLVLDGKKIGGAIIMEDSIRFPFLIPPYCDRVQFWTYLLKLAPRKYLRGMLDEDVAVLPMFNYKAAEPFMALCRPSDIVETSLPEGFICRPFDAQADVTTFGKIMEESHRYGFLGSDGMTPEDYTADAIRVLGIYALRSFSIAIEEKATGQMVGACLAGIGDNFVLGFAEVADICVLPQYRNRGFAKHMLGHIITQSYGVAPFVKIWVNTGNPSEYLYRQMGFIPGPRFTKMERRT